MNRSVHKDTCRIWDRGVCNCGPINAAPESRDAGGAAPSADSDGGANKQDRQLVNQGRDEGMRAAFLAMQEAQTGGGEAVAPEARADVLKQLRTAMDVVSALCDGSMRWTMSVPARPDSDPDLVISGALHAAEKLIATAPPAPPAPPAPLPGKESRDLLQQAYDALDSMGGFGFTQKASKAMHELHAAITSAKEQTK